MAPYKRNTTGSVCPNCGASETGCYLPEPPWGYVDKILEHKPDCADTSATPINCYEWDAMAEAGNKPKAGRPFGPDKKGSPYCRSGSIASGGTREYCTCDTCF